MKYGGYDPHDLESSERANQNNDDGNTLQNIVVTPGMRFGGRDESSSHQIVTRIDHLEGRLPEHILEHLIPRVAEQARISQDTDRVPLIYYQSVSFGRLCSCFTSVESGADKNCPICWGMTFIPGFKKYGCDWQTIDITHPNMMLCNVYPNYDSGNRPIPLSLSDTAVRGRIETYIQLQPNVGTLDALRMGSYAPKGSSVTLYVKTQDEGVYTEVTDKSAIESRLLDGSGNPNTLFIRIDLKRSNPDMPTPSFTYLHIRYRLKNDITVVVDMARQAETIELQQYGITDSFDVLDFVIDRTLPNVKTGDLFIRVDNDPIRDGQRLMAINVDRWTPMRVLVETSIRARNVARDERWFRVL